MTTFYLIEEDDMGRKRTYGEGSIRNRGTKDNPRWYIGFRVDGKQKWETAGTSDRKVAEALLRQKLTKIDQGQGKTLLGTPFKDVAMRWLDNADNKGVRRSTLAFWESSVRCHLIPAFGNDFLHQITPAAIESYRNAKLQGRDMPVAGRAKKGGKLSTQTVAHHIGMLRLILDLAVRDGLASQNVARMIEVPRVERRDPPRLDASDVKKIISEIDDLRYKTLVLVTVSLGLRIGEALALTWNGYDEKTQTLIVSGSVVRGGNVKNGLVIGKPKTKAAVRHLRVGEGLHQSLMDLKTWCLGNGLPDWDDQHLIFRNDFGDLINPSNFRNRIWKPAVKRAGLEGAHIHDLRHTYVSEALAAGVPTHVVQARAGHSSPQSTAIYTHLTKRHLNEPADNGDLY